MLTSYFFKVGPNQSSFRQRLPTDLETYFKLSLLVLYSKKNKLLKTKLVNPFQLIKLSPSLQKKRGEQPLSLQGNDMAAISKRCTVFNTNQN